MSRRVTWLPDAIDDLGDAFDFVAETEPAFARKLVDRIEAAGNRLGIHSTGRPGRIAGTYEKSLPEVRYILVYELNDEQLNILRVVHAARDWKPDTWPAKTKPR